jgi:hypothetical protein
MLAAGPVAACCTADQVARWTGSSRRSAGVDVCVDDGAPGPDLAIVGASSAAASSGVEARSEG